MKTRILALFILAACLVSLPCSAQDPEPVIRIGMIGLDTSHATAFTAILNDPEHPQHVPGAKVVAGFKAFSPDIESSATRVDKFVEQLESKWGVEMFDDLDAMCRSVDAVMVESVDGRPHLEQASAAIRAGKPVFVDKPMAASVKDAVAIFKLAEEHGVPCWSASNVRFHPQVISLAESDLGEIVSALSHGPASLEPSHPDLFWYGIHATEALFRLMGPGCESVSRTYTEGTDVVTGIWKGGRTGTVMALRASKKGFGITAFGTKNIATESYGAAYPQLMEQVVEFFRTGEPPVTAQETLEILAFMEAADLSKERRRQAVSLAEVLQGADWNP